MQKDIHKEDKIFSTVRDFSFFLDTDVGSILFDQQLSVFNKYSSSFIGYNLLQLSIQNKKKLTQNTKVGHYVDMALTVDKGKDFSILQSNYLDFPIASDCFDNLILHHILDYSSNPCQVLRESDRVLRDGGNLMIMSFNPISSLPFVSLFSLLMKCSFPKPQFVRKGRVIDWLTILNYEISHQELFFYRLPINNNWLQKKTAWLDPLGQSIKLPIGLCYFLIAKKRSSPINPIHTSWSSIVKSAKQASVTPQQKNT